MYLQTRQQARPRLGIITTGTHTALTSPCRPSLLLPLLLMLLLLSKNYSLKKEGTKERAAAAAIDAGFLLICSTQRSSQHRRRRHRPSIVNQPHECSTRQRAPASTATSSVVRRTHNLTFPQSMYTAHSCICVCLQRN